MASIRVSATEKNPTHDVSITDGVTTIGLKLCDGSGNPTGRGIRVSGFPRTSMRISQGTSGYNDMEMPYSPVVQSDFGGGRGNEILEKDTTRYLDGERCDSSFGELVLGPQETETTGYFTINKQAGSLTGKVLDKYTVATGTQYVSSKITIGANALAARKLGVTYWLQSLKVKKVVTQYSAIVQLIIYSDNSGAPGSAVFTSDSKTITSTDTLTPIAIEFPCSYTMTANTTYWMVFKVITTATAGALSKNKSVSGNSIQTSTNGTSWTATVSNQAIEYWFSTTSFGMMKFFQYKGAMYAVSIGDDGFTPKIFINGYRGAAADNAANKLLLKSGLTLTQNELAGCYAKIVEGPGGKDRWKWRKIVSNTTGGDITVDKAWSTTHTTATKYVIIGANTWSEVTSTGLTGPVTDVCVVDNIVYFCQGDLINIRRMQWDSATHNVHDFADDGSNKATFMEAIPDNKGSKQVWKALATGAQVDYSKTKAWGTNLSFSGAIICGSSGVDITGLIGYGNPVILWVLKEDEFGSVNNNVYAMVPLGEMGNAPHEYNGRVSLTHGVFLYFTFLNGLERYYDQRLDDIGPDRDEGLPLERRGPISALIGYPGRFYAAIDGGDTGYSSVLMYNGTGWMELYRAAFGRRIRDMAVQAIPGDAIDRLWISEEEEIIHLPVCIRPKFQTDYIYNEQGSITTSWMYGGLMDVPKYYRAIKLFTENIVDDHQEVLVEFRVDDDLEWTTAGTITSGPVQEIVLSASNNINGRRIQFRYTLTTDDQTKTPTVIAAIVEAVTRVPVKQQWAITFLASTAMVDMQGKQTASDTDVLIDQLMTWSNSTSTPNPLTMRSTIGLFDNKSVFIDPASVQPIEVVTQPGRKARMVGTIALFEA